MKKIFVKFTALTLMLVVMVCFAGCNLFSINKGSIENLPPSTDLLGNVELGKIENGTREEQKDKVEVIKNVRRSVVAIAIYSEAEEKTYFGSGVIVDMDKKDASGNVIDNENEFYIMTCHHVIEHIGDITVYLADRECDNVGESDYDDAFAFSGRIDNKIYNNAITLVGGDKTADIALLKLDIRGSQISKEDIVEASFPIESYNAEVGEDVIAIGNPSGRLPGTVSFGTISYINRETSISDVGNMTLLQINADIYHGSSGGALFNMYGELIGITNAGSDAYVGINYSIPYIIDRADGVKDNGFINIASQLLASANDNNYGYITGRVATFGFTTQLTDNKVQITKVELSSIALREGLQVNDVIYKVGKNVTEEQLKASEEVTSSEQVSSVFKSLAVGDTVSLLIKRQAYYSYTEHVVKMTAKQHIFCDTGYYPSAE